MSNMLQQAIVDAQTLREAALKNAESAIVEKYSEEVKDAVSRLLEQEPGEEATSEEETEVSFMEEIPMAHISGEPGDDEEIVTVDLDDIIAASEADEAAGEEQEFEMDREEIADEVGIDLEEPANRTDEISLDESELVDLFQELLAVDVPQVELDRTAERIQKDELEQDELEQDIEIEYERTDGMDEEDAEEYRKAREQNESLRKTNKNLKNQNTNLKEHLESAKNVLEEISLQNARLLYANRVLTDNSLNERQKNKIADMVGRARSVEEAKTIFETLQKTMVGQEKRSPQSLSEAVTKRSSVILSGRRESETKSPASSSTYNRWAVLAGMNNTD